MARMLWTQREDIGPPKATGIRLAYDPARKMTMLLHRVGPTSATWLWDGELWLQISDIGPSQFDSLVFDPARKLMVASDWSALWECSGNEWTQVSDQPTASGAAVFDERAQRLLRVTHRFKLPCLTWRWGGGAWTQIDDMGPMSRRDFELASDRERGVVVLAGGCELVPMAGGSGATEGPVRDTWIWDGAWRAITDIGPSPRKSMAMAYDRDRARVVAFGGFATSSSDPWLGDTWEWDGAQWRQVQNMGPSRRSGSAMTYDTDRTRIVLFGGSGPSAVTHTDTWEYYDHA